MKITLVLCRQHLERMARRHWYIQGKRKVYKTKAEEQTTAQGYQVVDAVETFINPPKQSTAFDLKAVSEDPLPYNSTHPDYKLNPCYVFNDNNVLLGGLRQAQVLTNTILASGQLPESLLKQEAQIKVSDKAHAEFQKQILLACAFDAEQQKLPRKKDPLRPAWRFPRDYGITDARKNELLCLHILRLCEQFQRFRDLSIVTDVNFSLPLNAHGKQMQINLSSEVFVTSERSLTTSQLPLAQATQTLPDIYPMNCTISLEPTHFYDFKDHFPLRAENSRSHIHTALIHYNPTQVGNLYDSPVTPDQMEGRLLLKAFCFAACEARALQQGEVTSPVSVQVVQTDGQNFCFATYQLNTLDVEGSDGRRNVFWLTPSLPLYKTCRYISGRPVLEEYNPAVLQRMMAFLTVR